MLLRKSMLSKFLSFLLAVLVLFSPVLPQTRAYAADSDYVKDSSEIKDSNLPTFTGDGATPEPTDYTNGNMMQSIYDADMAAGGTSFWMDRMLARPGDDPSTSDNQGNMLSKGRSIWMGWHDPSKLGFAGEVAYIDDSDKDQSLSKTDGVSGYIIDLTSSGLKEDVSKRVSYPSYWTSEYNDSNGLNVNIKKFFTENNVAVSVLEIKNNSTAAKTLTMNVTSPRAAVASGDELTGEYQAPRGLTTVYPRISGDGLTASGTNLTGTFSLEAGETVSKKVVMGFITKEIPESKTDYERFKGYDPNTAFTTQVQEYNQWWGDNIPYIDVPDANIKKMIYYRWWLDRFNLQDDELPLSKGYAFPTSVEGVTGYNNAITLPLPWQLEESRYLRNPDLNYGTWLSMGATAGGGDFKDNPASPFWTYGPEMKAFVNYITEAGWESYKVFGGQDAILSKFADYGYNDVKDFMKKYDTNNDDIITLPDGSWTGFDSDSPVTKYFNGDGGSGATGGSVDSLTTAYEYADAQAASEMYSELGNTAKADEMSTLADNIKNAVLTKMWDSDKQEFLHKAANDDNHLNPWKDITNFYPFTMGLVPTNDAKYKEMFKLWTNPNDFVVWPALIGDKQDSQAAEAAGKSMTYNSAPSSMGVTLSFLAKAVKDYPSQYITADTYKQLLYWGAWGMYVGGNTNYPDANEFWSDVTDTSMGYRSWIHHNMHSKYNVSIIEDVAGLTPREDNKIELNPIDIGWGHFTVNNLRYHDKDMSIIWNGDSYYKDIPQGYSVYINGDLMFTASSLKHLVWDASTGDVSFSDGDTTVTVSNNVSNSSFQTADQVSYSNDSRVATMFKKVATNITGTASVTGVSVDSSKSLFVNETKQLTATVAPADAQNQAVTWHSDNPAIATVDQYGNVTGVSEGTTTITATTEDGGFTSAPCTVTVSQANAGDYSEVVLDNNQMHLAVNDTGKITASVQGAYNDLTNLALNKRGTGYPTPSASYTCNGDNAWFAVNGDNSSGQRWTSWNSQKPTDWFQVDFGTNKDVNRLALDFYDDGGGVVPPASYKVQYWDGAEFVDVQNAKQTPATPTSTVQNVVQFNTVNTQKIQVVMTNKNPVNFGSYVGLKEIGAYYDPYYLQSLSWNSDQSSVATVDQDGNVTAKSAGAANITAVTQDGKHQAQCAVTVSAVDKTQLSQKISYTQGLVQNDFTSESWTALQDKLLSADGVNKQADATQAEVNTALNDLKVAINSLKYQTDHSIIDFSSNGTGTLDFGGGDQVKRFQTFIARPGYVNITGIDVKIIDNNANDGATFELYNADSSGMPVGSALASATVSKSDIDSNISQNNSVVHAALNYSGLIPGNKYAIALGQVIIGDNAHDYKWYSSADISNGSWWQSNVMNPQIQQDGQNVPSGKYDGTNWVDESRLGDYWLKVFTAKVAPVDNSALQKLYDDNKDKSNSNYTEITWNAFQQALNAAKVILQTSDATQVQVDNAKAALQKAISELKAGVDRFALETAISNTAKYKQSNYTADSWNALQQALASAKTLDQKLDASQSDIDAATKSLNSAILNLKSIGSSHSSDPTSPTTPTPPTTSISDTTHDFNVNASYQFRITSKNGKVPKFVVGTPGVFEVQLVKTTGSDYFFKLTAIGAPGASAGIYLDGGSRLLVATVKSNPSYVKCDTVRPFSVNSGKAYTFKLTANSKPSFVAGTPGIFKVDFVKQTGKDYFFKITTIAKSGNSSGFYINGQKNPVTVVSIQK